MPQSVSSARPALRGGTFTPNALPSNPITGETIMRKTLTALISGAAVASPIANAAAATAATQTKVTTTTKTVSGPQAQVDRWGYIKVTLVVRKTTSTTGTKK